MRICFDFHITKIIDSLQFAEHTCACLKMRLLGSFSIPQDVASYMASLGRTVSTRVPYSEIEYWNLLLNETFPDYYAPIALARTGVNVWTNQDQPKLMAAQNDAVGSYNAAIPSTGSFEMKTFGFNFALQFRSSKAALMPSDCQFSMWISDSTTKCKVSNGLPHYFAGSITIDLQQSTVHFSPYINQSTPVIRHVLFSSLACTGSLSEIVISARLGQVQQSGAARVQLSACQSSTWLSESSIRCRGMSGAGLFIGGYVSVAQVASASVSRVFSYQLHTVASARVGTLGGGSGDGLKSVAASGGLIVGVLGRGYSTVGSSHSARLRGSGCSQSVWLSDSDLLCRSVWGKDLSSYSKDVVVSVVQQWFGLPNAMSYASVVPMAASVERVPTTGGSVVGVSGRDIGGFGTSARLQLQGTAFESSRWISSSMMVGKRSHGYGSKLSLILSAACQPASTSPILNHRSPLPSTLKPSTGPGRGGLLVTLFGSNFGSALVAAPSQMQVRLGGTVCTPSLSWTADSAVTFIHPAGVLPGLTVDIATDLQLFGELRNAFGFAKPVLTGISPAVQPTSGRSDISFYGMSFGGDPHDLARLKIGSTPCSLTTWLSDSSARCRIPPGVSNQLTATYSIGNYVTAVTRVYTYFSPVVGSVRPSYGNTRGGNLLSIAGSSFGYGAHFRYRTCAVGFKRDFTHCNTTSRVLPANNHSGGKQLSEAAVLLRLFSALRGGTRPRRFSGCHRQCFWAKRRTRQLVRNRSISRTDQRVC
jgi:hypothetical protein